MSRRRILVVEDKQDKALQLKEYLELHDFEVQVAFTGKEALKLFANSSFQLLLTDYKLPDCTGFALATECLKRRDVNVIYLTGMSRQQLDSRIKTGQKCQILDKAGLPKEMLAAIEKMV